MPRQSSKVPSCCLHKASNRAVVRLGGRDHYRGPCASPEGYDESGRPIAEWRVRREQIPVSAIGLALSKHRV